MTMRRVNDHDNDTEFSLSCIATAAAGNLAHLHDRVEMSLHLSEQAKQQTVCRLS